MFLKMSCIGVRYPAGKYCVLPVPVADYPDGCLNEAVRTDSCANPIEIKIGVDTVGVKKENILFTQHAVLPPLENPIYCALILHR